MPASRSLTSRIAPRHELVAEVRARLLRFGAPRLQLHTRDAAHRAATTIRRTWLPAAILVAFGAVSGFAFERIAPDARSIGGVVRELTSGR